MNAWLRISYNTLASLCVGGKGGYTLTEKNSYYSDLVKMQKCRKSMVRNLTRPSRGTSEHYEVVYKLLPGHDVTNGQNFQQIGQANTSIFKYSYCLN